MAILQLYDKLLQFPLFQGMSRDDLEIIAGHTRFGFERVGAGRCVAEEGAPCTCIHLLLNGTLRIETFSDDHRYWMTESMSAPYLFQLDAIFGYNQRYTHRFTALTEVNFITIDNEEVLRLLEDMLVLRLNLMNIYATQMQKLTHLPWRSCPQTLRQHVIRFIVSRCVYPSGHKRFHILMTRMAEELNDSRLDVSRCLNQLQRDGLLQLQRGMIDIPSLERLITEG